MKLYTYAKPTIESGTYRLEVEQQIDVKEEQVTYHEELEFTVTQSVLQLDEADIHSIYPPANSVGNFDDQLPYIQFDKISLPWQHLFVSEGIPWISLFVFQELDDIRINHGTWKEFFSYTNDTISMKREELSMTEESFDYIDIFIELFENITPTLEELPYLASVKEIDGEDKISQLLSNQYLTSQSNRLCLISLQGLEDIYRNMELLKLYTYIRVPLLKSWNVTMEGDLDMFEYYFEHLDVMGYSEDTSKEKMYYHGYVAMNHLDRNGNHLISWYHGPLMNQVVPELKLTGTDYDEYLTYDPLYGMLDVSYSVAYQLGTLLAFRNQQIIALVSKAKKNREDKLRVLQEMEMYRQEGFEEDQLEELIRQLRGGSDAKKLV